MHITQTALIRRASYAMCSKTEKYFRNIMKNIQTIRNHANKQLTAVGQGGEGNPIYNVYGDYEITHNKKHVESNRPP